MGKYGADLMEEKWYQFEQILPLVQPCFGQSCVRKRIGDYGMLSVDFGQKIYHNKPRHADPFYGEWQFGSYHCAWRIFRENRLVLGSKSLFETHTEFDVALQAIEFGKLQNFEQFNAVDFVLTLDNALQIEFLTCSNDDDDETFHIFLPNNCILVYSLNKHWQYGKAIEANNSNQALDLAN